jgi:hypothetical protein
MSLKADFSKGRAIGTSCETNGRDEYRMCWATDASVKLSGWCITYEVARRQAIKTWRKLRRRLEPKTKVSSR